MDEDVGTMEDATATLSSQFGKSMVIEDDKMEWES